MDEQKGNMNRKHLRSQNRRPLSKEILTPQPAKTCAELASRCEKLARLPQEEAEAFASDIERARASLQKLKGTRD
jgi:hypothetical protein